MLEQLKKEVFQANQQLVEMGLVVLTWGNASAISADRRYVVIKPSGIEYSRMTEEQMVVVDMEGNIVEGNLRPSSDLPTHLEIYKNFTDVGGVVHTHSCYATAMAQAERDLQCFGTTHADHFFGAVPCTRSLTEQEVLQAYERNTGKVIVETFKERGIDPMAVPAVLVCKHGPFSWGQNVRKAVENALVLDRAAYMAIVTLGFDCDIHPAPSHLLEKHYQRKHGANAYYGQK